MKSNTCHGDTEARTKVGVKQSQKQNLRTTENTENCLEIAWAMNVDEKSSWKEKIFQG